MVGGGAQIPRCLGEKQENLKVFFIAYADWRVIKPARAFSGAVGHWGVGGRQRQRGDFSGEQTWTKLHAGVVGSVDMSTGHTELRTNRVVWETPQGA